MRTKAIDLRGFDLSISAADNLFAHVNGVWSAVAKIPDDKSSWGVLQKLREDSEAAVKAIIDDIDTINTPNARRIAALYNSFMDTERIEELGTSPLKSFLQMVDSINTTADLAFFWGWCLRHRLGGVFSINCDVAPSDPSRYVAFISQSGLGLADEEYYRLDMHAEIRQAYQMHIATMFALAGLENAAEQAKQAFTLETKIAALHWDKTRTNDLSEMNYQQTWEAFTADSPALHWDSYLIGAKLPLSAVAKVVNCQRTFPSALCDLVTSESLPDWRAWERWQIINSLSWYLPAEFVEQSFAFYGHVLSGIPALRERWKRGVTLVDGVLGEAIGRIYTARHFSPRDKKQVEELVANLLEAFRRSITSLEWMTDETRNHALTKLSKLRVKIGYPVKWRDYSALHLGDNLITNLMASNSFRFDHMIAQLISPINPDEWLLRPQSVNCYYHPLRNEIVLPAAILQPPFFNPSADAAVNYGSIGAVIGHEIGHGFDERGSICDGDGRLHDWWSDIDRAAFKNITTKLTKQYDSLSPIAAPEARINGKLTLNENIGDLGGLCIAYRAWQIAIEGQEPPTEDGYTPDQRFFLGWAQSRRAITRPETARARAATDPHAPEEVRCNQVVRNMAAFHEAFKVTPEDAMWLAPEERVNIW